MAGGDDSDAIGVDLGRERLRAAGFVLLHINVAGRGELWQAPEGRVAGTVFVSYLGRDNLNFALESLRSALELAKK